MSSTIPKALYGYSDSRQDIYSLSDEQIKKQASSVACLVNEDQIGKDISTGEYYLKTQTTHTLKEYLHLKTGHPLGENELFGNQFAWGRATAFLITNRLVLTAGHCAPQAMSGKTVVVFGFQMEDKNVCKTRFQEDEVYKIKRVVAYRLKGSNLWEDWAIFKLDKEVKGRNPLTVSFSCITGTPTLYMLGHPTGLPMKFAGSEETTIKTHLSSNSFKTNIDAFKGNSGSPIFSRETNEVIGILCEGNEDYAFDPNYENTGAKRCVTYKVSWLQSMLSDYEKCQRTSNLILVQKKIDSWKSGYQMSSFRLQKQLNNLPQKGGFYILGKCKNNQCSESKDFTWIWQGIGKTYYLSEVLVYSTCTLSHKKIEIKDIGIYRCDYEITGKLPDEEKSISKTGKVGQMAMKIFDPLNKFNWDYLKVNVQQLTSENGTLI